MHEDGSIFILPWRRRFHLLKPEYIYHRIKELQRSYRLSIIMCHVDTEDAVEPLAQVCKHGWGWRMMDRNRGKVEPPFQSTCVDSPAPRWFAVACIEPAYGNSSKAPHC